MTAMTVFQFVYFGSSGFAQQLVTHADTKNRKFRVLHGTADVLHRSITCIRVTRSVGDEESVEFQMIEIIIPRHANHFHIPAKQAADNVRLYTAIHQYDFFLTRAFIVTDHLFTGNLVYVVHPAVNSFRSIFRFIVKHNPSHHHSVFTQHFGQLTGIDARNARHLLPFQPVRQTFHCIPMAVFL